MAPPDFNGAAKSEEIERNPQTGGRDSHISVPGGVFHNPASAYAREMAKYEMDWGSPYGRPGRPRADVGPQPFPCRMYLVERAETGGGVVVKHSADAASEVEMRNFESRGYRNGLQAAADALKASEDELAVLAANRAALEQRMSPEARAEAADYEASVPGHVAVIPEKRGPGRPRKDEDRG